MVWTSIRIALVAFVLVGGTSLFGLWALQQFNVALANLAYTPAPSVAAVGASLRDRALMASTTPDGVLEGATTTELLRGVATTSLERVRGGTATTSASTNFIFISPVRGASLYTGCTYPVSWLASSTVKSLDIKLVDAGTLKQIGSLRGLASTTDFSRAFSWKVGKTWPGAYYLLLSSVNGVDSPKKRSETFTIASLPVATSTTSAEQKALCAQSGGTL